MLHSTVGIHLDGIADRADYSKHGLWRIGLGLIIFGSFADFAALSFAPQVNYPHNTRKVLNYSLQLVLQSLVAPLGSLTLVSNVVFAPILLRETIGTRDIIGTVTIVIGSAVAVAFASHEDVVYCESSPVSIALQFPLH